MSLEVLKSLRERLVENRSPAQHLVNFIINHSNSTDYLISNLESILDALKEDRAAEGRVFQMVVNALKKERKQCSP